MRALILAVLLATSLSPGMSAQTGIMWLDRPMTPWNQTVTSVPTAPAGSEAQSALERRCGSSSLSASPNGGSVRKAGWVPFLHFDRAIVRDDVEVIGGMIAASAGCEPMTFNLFVFAGGKFAGTLSPIVMTQARAGVAGAVRITSADAVTAEFARYTGKDTECCPSSRVRVTYRIDRATPRPILIPLDLRTLR